MLVWNDDEKDAFAELINVGMGLAASALSSMLGQEILLSVPSVEFISRQEMGQRFSRDVGNDIVGVRQAFQGAVEGNIALLFAKDSSFNLVGELVGDEVPLEDLPDIEQEAIAQVGYIVLNACLAAIADALHLKIRTGLPLFVRGIPVWATLIALTHAEHGVTIGVVSAPALGRRWWAATGQGSFANGRRCQVSDVSSIADAQVCVTFNDGWDHLGLTPNLVALLQQARRARGFGDFWQHCLVAEGAVDVAIDAVGVKPYDIAAVRLVVEEAGGTFTDRFGTVTHESDTAVSSNGRLHDTVIAALRRAPTTRSGSDQGVSSQ